MAVIKGKWKLIDTSNMEAFHHAINTPAESKAKALALSAAAEKDPTNHLEGQLLDIDVSDGKIQRSIIVNGEKIWGTEYKIGVEQESSAPDGRPVKVSNHLVSDTKIIFVNKGSDFAVTGSMEAEEDGLTVTTIGNGVTAYQKFIRI